MVGGGEVQMPANATSLTASLENYLETILLLIRERAVARSRDISARLKVTQASVTGALQALGERGLVNYEPYGYVTLTAAGEEAACKVWRRHEALLDFFVKVLAIDPAEADEAACRMEHGISKRIVDRLVEFARFVETCPRAGEKWVRGFACYCAASQHKPENCEGCINACLDELKFRQQNIKARSNSRDKAMTLNQLQPGEKGMIEKIGGGTAIRRRLADMGVNRDSLAEVIRLAPMGDPMEVKIKGYNLSLRREESENILVRKVDGP